ncbi:hypothetical protein HDU80_000909 [Chytriomyces hyalinus]|nr:hypothetical protein HDU80_000909 [Chytriomyces hyalinus]
MNFIDPINIDEIDVSKIDIVLPKKESNQNGRMFYVTYDRNKLRVILPELTAPFGAGNSEKYPDKYSMCLAFDGAEEASARGQRLQRANLKMRAINERVLQLVLEKRDIIFKDKKKVSDEILVNRYKPFVISDDDKPDRMYLTLQRKKVTDAFKWTEAERVEQGKQFVSLNGYSFLIDRTGNEISVNSDNIRTVIPWGSRIKPVIEFAYLWVLGSSQDCFPVWTYVHGLLTTSQQANSFSLLNELEPYTEAVSNTQSEDDVANKSFTMNLEEIEANA